MNSYENKSQNKLWKGLLIGALAGAAISMMDRNTRAATIDCAKRGYQSARSIIQNPDMIMGSVRETSSRLRSTIESISEDVSAITSQVETIKEITPQLASVVKETKEVFTEENEKQTTV
ncbi:MAG: YtxH domain-containing protein [Bacillus sp. (in: firmicutes)]